MKVAQINAVYGYGSTGVIVKDIEHMLAQNNEESCIICQKTDKSENNIFCVGNWLDWKLHALSSRVLGKQGYSSVLSTYRLLKYLDTQKPDIVHLHNLHSNYVNLNMLLSYLAKNNIPTVLTLHDCWFFTGKCFHFIASGCEKWKTKCGNCPQNKEDIKSLFFDQSKKVHEDKIRYFQNIHNLTVVGCSDWIKNLAEISPVFKDKSIIRIYNGVDTSIFYPRKIQMFRKMNDLDNKFVILGMANKWLQDTNKEVFEKILSNLVENDVVVIAGCSDEQKNVLLSKKNVIPVGYINDRAQLADLYSSSNVFVNLTFEDTLPTVNMESICCGTPVITYDSCGSPELIREGKTGYVVPKLNSQELLNALNKIKKGSLDRISCAEIGRNMFDKDIQYLEYLELYRNLCRKG